MGFRRIFLLHSKSYGDTRSASKMPVKGFFDTLKQARSALLRACLLLYASSAMRISRIVQSRPERTVLLKLPQLGQ